MYIWDHVMQNYQYLHPLSQFPKVEVVHSIVF